MMRQEGFLRVKEAAEMLGVSPNTVRAWGADVGYEILYVATL